MAKQKKTNQIVVHPVHRKAIADVRGAEGLIELLRPELEWPRPCSSIWGIS